MTTDPQSDFDLVSSLLGFPLEDIKEFWEVFSQGFNDSAKHNRFTHLLDVSLNDIGLTLAVRDYSRLEAGIPKAVTILLIMESHQTYDLYCNLDPYKETRTNDDPKDGTLFTETKFPRIPGVLENLIARCKGEIMASVSAEQGLAYGYYNQLLQSTPTPGEGGPPIN